MILEVKRDAGSCPVTALILCRAVDFLNNVQIRQIYHPKSIVTFLTSAQKNMFWILSKSTLLQHIRTQLFKASLA